MVQYLPSGSQTNDNGDGEIVLDVVVEARVGTDYMADLKVFWGPEICRLEYLVHLLDTGRIKDEYWPQTAPGR